MTSPCATPRTPRYRKVWAIFGASRSGYMDGFIVALPTRSDARVEMAIYRDVHDGDDVTFRIEPLICRALNTPKRTPK